MLVGRVCGAPPLPGDPIGNFVRPITPFYRIRFDDGAVFDCCADADAMRAEVDGEIAVIERWILEGASCE